MILNETSDIYDEFGMINQGVKGFFFLTEKSIENLDISKKVY